MLECNIKFSIIIPIYNVQKYLPKCLDSLLNQTLTDIEIICINDGSTDNSLQILKNYANKDNKSLHLFTVSINTGSWITLFNERLRTLINGFLS